MGFLLPDTLSVWAPGRLGARRRRAGAPAGPRRADARPRPLPGRARRAAPRRSCCCPSPRARIARAVLGPRRADRLQRRAARLRRPVRAADRPRRRPGGAAAVVFVAGVGGARRCVARRRRRVEDAPRGGRPGRPSRSSGRALLGAAGIAVAQGGLARRRSAPARRSRRARRRARRVRAPRASSAALYLDSGDGAAARRARGSGAAGSSAPGVRAFVALGARLVVRTRYPRGIVLNAVAMTLAVGAVRDRLGRAATHARAAARPLDRDRRRLGRAVRAAVRERPLRPPADAARRADARSSAPRSPRRSARRPRSAIVQLALAAVLAPRRVAWRSPRPSCSAAACSRPAAVFGSTLAPKPLDVDDRFMTSSRVQSLPPQLVLAAAGSVAVALFAALGPGVGPRRDGRRRAPRARSRCRCGRAPSRPASSRRHAVAAASAPPVTLDPMTRPSRSADAASSHGQPP